MVNRFFYVQARATKKPDISVELIRASCRDQRGMQFQRPTDYEKGVWTPDLL